MKELIELADLLDEKGLTVEADLADQALQKTARKGISKCGLKEESVNLHLELFEGYKKSLDEHQKNYKKALLSSNSKDTPNSGELREALKGISHNQNSVHLHTMYIEDVIESKPIALERAEYLWEELNSRYYGSRNKIKSDLKRVAKTCRSGWVLLTYCVNTGKIYLDIVDLHDLGTIAGRIPILAVDLWEHAYFNDFGNDKDEYLDWVFSRINWRNVERRLKRFVRIK